MSTRFMSITAVLLVLTLLTGCEASSPTPAPSATSSSVPMATSVPPTATSVPPTPTVTPLPPLTGSGGGRIVFASRRGEGDYEIYVMNADGTDKRQLTWDTFESEGPTWSPDGTQIAFTIDTYSGSSDIYVMNADGSNLRRLTTNGGAGPAWSPAPPGGGTSGTRIAFILSKPDSDIYVMSVPDGADADGAEQGSADQQRLTKTGRNMAVVGPAWSPDGTQIVCVVNSNAAARGPSGKSTIYVLNVEDALRSGGASIADLRPLPRVGKDVNDKPAWSPTGSQIAFSAVVNNRRDLYVVNADGTNLRQITQTQDFDEFCPAWSPDGTQIAFQANPDSNWDIFIMNADGTGRRRLTTDVANDTAPDWSP